MTQFTQWVSLVIIMNNVFSHYFVTSSTSFIFELNLCTYIKLINLPRFQRRLQLRLSEFKIMKSSSVFSLVVLISYITGCSCYPSLYFRGGIPRKINLLNYNKCLNNLFNSFNYLF